MTASATNGKYFIPRTRAVRRRDGTDLTIGLLDAGPNVLPQLASAARTLSAMELDTGIVQSTARGISMWALHTCGAARRFAKLGVCLAGVALAAGINMAGGCGAG